MRCTRSDSIFLSAWPWDGACPIQRPFPSEQNRHGDVSGKKGVGAWLT